MLPQTPFQRGHSIQPHESINDLPVHPSTGPQLFHPTSESRHFTREDAARVFHPKLLPADARIPHPELIDLERDKLAGIPLGERNRRHERRLEEDVEARVAQKQAAQDAVNKVTRVVKGRRWDFKFTEVNAENVGKDGRGVGAVGWRYGMPLEDRKRAQVKIPTSVP